MYYMNRQIKLNPIDNTIIEITFFTGAISEDAKKILNMQIFNEQQHITEKPIR